MSDKITQLQTQLSVMVSTMIDSVGCLQQIAPPVQIRDDIPLSASLQPPLLEENAPFKSMEEAQEMATKYGQDFVSACLTFEKLLNELPQVDTKQQTEQLKQLDEKNSRGTEELVSRTHEAQVLLDQISSALKQISDHHFHMKKEQVN